MMRLRHSKTTRLALALLSLAATAGLPDSFWETDSRIRRARQVLKAAFGEERAAQYIP